MSAAAARHAPVRALVGLGVLLAAVVTAVHPVVAHAMGPADVSVTRDLAYGKDQDGKQLLLDVYRPQTSGFPGPVIILIHGGGWVSGDKAEYEPFARSLAVTGFVVFDVNYSLDPGRSAAYPRQVTDVRAALAWVQQHAGRYNGDTGRLAVAGGSAGGYLAAMLGTQANTSAPGTVDAVVSLSGPMDLVGLVSDLRAATASTSGPCGEATCADVFRASERLRALVGCDPLQCPEQTLREASPITYVTPDSPPFFLANSTAEIVPAAQATGMATALRAQHVPVELDLVPGAGHALAYATSIGSRLLDFLESQVGPGAPAATETATTGNGDPRPASRAKFVRWLVVAAALCLLGGIVVARRRATGGPAHHRGDPLEHPATASGDPR